jgi:epoxyqueuosine reductase QueG
MPQDITFAAEYFIVQVLTPFHQNRMSLSQNAARQEPNLHFDNSECQTAQSVADEMAKLRSKRGVHLPYSHNRAICDFCLFSCPKDQFAGLHAHGDAEFLREVQRILTAIDQTKVKTDFGHWIERCQGLSRAKVNTILNKK